MDIYTKRNIEYLYSEDILEETNELREYIQKIKMILFTRPGETNDLNFGMDLEYQLFKTNLTNSQLEDMLKHQISTYCPEYSNFQTNIIVKFYNMGSHDECEITIGINNSSSITIKTF